jgi:hypothetical protein
LTPTSTGRSVGAATCATGVDFQNAPLPVVFAPGETVKTVAIQLCGDVSADTDEAVNLTLTSQSPLSGVGNSAVLTINDTANQFRNSAPVTLIQGAAANPSLSTINVTGATSNTFRIRVTLYDLYHDRPDNIDALLVGPNGAKYTLMGDVGGTTSIFQAGAVTLTFADYPTGVLPDASSLATGIFRPTTCETPVTNFSAPAPAGPYVEPGCVVARATGQMLYGNFANTSANGPWSLYIRDDNGVSRPGDQDTPDIILGEVQGGWGIELLPSTASGIDISGRVTTPDGRGLRNAVVTISDSRGQQRTVTTGSFGYYRFYDVEPGSSVVIGVISNRYRFASRLVQVVDTISDLDFAAID